MLPPARQPDLWPQLRPARRLLHSQRIAGRIGGRSVRLLPNTLEVAPGVRTGSVSESGLEAVLWGEPCRNAISADQDQHLAHYQINFIDTSTSGPI